jgi:hypothetical protein
LREIHVARAPAKVVCYAVINGIAGGFMQCVSKGRLQRRSRPDNSITPEKPSGYKPFGDGHSEYRRCPETAWSTFKIGQRGRLKAWPRSDVNT